MLEFGPFKKEVQQWRTRKEALNQGFKLLIVEEHVTRPFVVAASKVTRFVLLHHPFASLLSIKKKKTREKKKKY